MSGSSKADLAVLATSGVLTADQLMRAIESSHEGKGDHAKKHFGYAAVGAAVAIGALELLRRDEKRKNEESDSEYEDEEDDRHERAIIVRSKAHKDDHDPPGHRRRLAEEMVGAYALGQEILGHKKNHVAHVVAEVLGAVAALKNTRDHVHGVE